MAHGLYFLPTDAFEVCHDCDQVICACGDEGVERDIEVICHRTRYDFWWDVYVDGELTHEHCDRIDLEKLGLERYPVAQTYWH